MLTAITFPLLALASLWVSHGVAQEGQGKHCQDCPSGTGCFGFENESPNNWACLGRSIGKVRIGDCIYNEKTSEGKCPHCVNGAHDCSNTERGYICSCAAGYQDKNCATRSDEYMGCGVFHSKDGNECWQNCISRANSQYTLLPCRENQACPAVRSGDSDASDSSCISRKSTVILSNGQRRPLVDAHNADEFLALTSELNLDFSKFLGHIHYNKEVTARFLNISTKRNQLSISPKHLVYTSSIQEPIVLPADKLNPGDMILGLNNDMELEPQQVKSIHEVFETGYVAPMTGAGTIIANGILISNYVDVLGGVGLDYSDQAVYSHISLWWSRMTSIFLPAMDILGDESAAPFIVQSMWTVFNTISGLNVY